MSKNTSVTSEASDPLIPAHRYIPEITLKGTIVAIFLVAILAAANAFLSLKVGITISASIPAAVISMGILRFFRQHNVLENNIVQTAASAGEALTAGIAYTIPALIVLHFWAGFNYWTTAMIAMLGGFLGVFFTIPIRRAMLDDKTLRFPEGVAIGNVLKVSAKEMDTREDSIGLKDVLMGGGVGALIAFMQGGLKVIADSLGLWVKTSSSIFGIGLGFSPALIGAGYIIGTAAAVSLVLGVILGWVIGVPLLIHFFGMPQTSSAAEGASLIWANHIRYIGLGTFLIGGVGAIVSMFRPLAKGIFLAIKASKHSAETNLLRTEFDIPLRTVFWGIFLVCIPLALLFYLLTQHSPFSLGSGALWGFVIVNVLFALLASFIFTIVCGYFAGLVGSSASPISSMAMLTLILSSLVIFTLLKITIHMSANSQASNYAAAFAILLTGVVCAACGIGNDTMQDLKAGQMVGATPWKQELMMLLGVTVAALVIPRVLQLLFDAYGMAGVFPHPGMDHSQMLQAPQANLMAAIAKAVFNGRLDWDMIGIGVLIGLACFVLNAWLHTKDKSLPILGVGMGIYLPLSATTPLIIGGVVAYFSKRRLLKRYKVSHPDNYESHIESHSQHGLLMACGLVAGASLVGVILAVPFVIMGSSDALSIVSPGFKPIATALGVLAAIGLAFMIYRTVVKKR